MSIEGVELERVGEQEAGAICCPRNNMEVDIKDKI